MERVLTAQTVVKDLFKGVLTVLILGVCAFSIFLIIFIVVANNSPDVREQAEWCAEYMPDASSSECAAEAGW